jgi:glycosyltransferase involved in cell wall biosynthesis
VNERVQISAIVPVCELFEDGVVLVEEYFDEMQATNQRFELVYVLDGAHQRLIEGLSELASTDKRIRIIQLAKTFGEASALSAGFEYTSGDVILTLPAYSQVKPGDIRRVLAELERCDVAVAVREPARAKSSGLKRFRRRVFHWLVRIATRESFKDMGCGVRALKRGVADELPIYGDQYRFFPILASRRGFKVAEVVVDEAERTGISARHGPRAYLARMLDIFALIFLARFTKKPLRFFGTIGTGLFVVGAVFLAYLIIERTFFGVALADRPALLLSSLMVVLGLQVFALGLLGELIIFTHAKDIKEYTIERILN